MKMKNLLTSFFITMLLAAPLCAESNWVEVFLRRYQPADRSGNTSGDVTALGEMLQTGTVPIGMNDLVNLMLDQNLDIRSNRLSPRSSYYSSLVFYRALQPSLRMSTNLSSNTTASTSQLNGVGQDTITTKRRNYTVGFSQALAYGTSISVDATLDRQFSNGNINNYNPSYTSRITYTVGQKLLKDRGRLPNTRQIQQAENNQKISETNFEIQMVNLVVQAQRAYWDLVFAGEDLKVKQRSLELAQRTLDENQMKVEIGTLAPIELTLNRSDVANRRDAMLTSTFSVTTAEDQIKKLVSSQRDPSMFLLKFAAKDAPRSPASISIPSLEEAVRTALENRPEMRNSMLDIKNKQIDEQYTKNQLLPQFDVTATYNQNGVGGTLIRRATIGGASSSVIPGGVADSFHQLFTYNYTGFSMGFNFNMPMNFSTWKPWEFKKNFQNPAANADHDRARTESQLSQARMNASAQSIMLEVRNALTQVEQNRARIETALVSLDLARQRLDAEQTKFNLGTSTLRFVLEEQRNVAQAETTELQTRINLTKGLIELEKAMGLTLRNNNIELEKALQSPTASNYKPVSLGLQTGANQK